MILAAWKSGELKVCVEPIMDYFQSKGYTQVQLINFQILMLESSPCLLD